MKLDFNHVIPHPLRDYTHGDDSVWNNQFELNFPAKVILNASSGKGKSTFTNMLYGLRKDYDGMIRLNDRNIQEIPLYEWINFRQTKISAIFQDLQLFGDLSAWENLIIKNDLTQHKKESEIEDILSRLGMADKKNQRCSTLSFGQQQRIAIIRALLQPFELLLMDEPFSHLDEDNTSIALQLICEETDKNKAGFILTSLGSHHQFTFDKQLML